MINVIEKQKYLNCLIDPDWKINLSQDQFRLAASQEVCELIDHTGWKWWKNSQVNIKQVHFELVDILHFIVSISILRHDTNSLLYLKSILNTHSEFCETKIQQTSKDFLHNLTSELYSHSETIKCFAKLIDASSIDWDLLENLYFAKNILNEFRQKNGYKDGTYRKVWMGKEDNEHLYHMASKHKNDEIYEKLQEIYNGEK